MSVAEPLKTPLTNLQDANQNANAGSVFAKSGNSTPLRARNQQQNASGNDKSNDGGGGIAGFRGKNPPKPPEEFYKDLQIFHERRG